MVTSLPFLAPLFCSEWKRAIRDDVLTGNRLQLRGSVVPLRADIHY